MNIEEQYFTCKKCGESKIWGEFSRAKNTIYKIRFTCKVCTNTEYKIRRASNPDRIEYEKEWVEKNREKIRGQSKLRWISKKTNSAFMAERRAYLQNYRDINREKTRETHRAYVKNLTPQYLNNRLRKKGFTAEQINQNPELINIQRIITQTKRLCKT